MTIQVSDTDYLLPAGQALALADQNGIVDQASGHPTTSLTIAGAVQITISADPPQGALNLSDEIDAISTNSFGDYGSAKLLIAPTGALHMDSASVGRMAVGVIDNYGPAFLNQGLIDIKAAGAALGATIRDVGTPEDVTTLNAGTISVSATSGAATGLEIETKHGGIVNTGLIDVSGGQSVVGLHIFGPDSTENAGQVVVHDLTASAHSVAVQFDVSGGAATFINSGLIQGDVALKTNDIEVLGFSPTPSATILNSGTMIGEVDLDTAPHLLTNSGTISGAVNFGTSNDTYDGRAGTETGLISGGAGADTLMGGAGFDNLQGNQGNDSVSGGAGDDIVVGGKDDDIQAGGDGNDVVWGNLGNDTLDGGNGADQVRGGQGDDSISGGAGNDFISGDRGNDTESGGAGADNFHGSQDAGIDRVLDFNLAEGDRVQLDPGTTYTVSQVGADTVIDMGAGNQMILVGVQMSTLTPGWIFEG